MLFDSFVFAWFFIPIIVLYYLLPVKSRWWLILLASMGFYMWSDMNSIFVPILIILISYLGALSVERATDVKRKQLIHIFSIAFIIGMLVFYKYVFFLVSSVTHIPVADSFFASLVVPLGISYISFQAIGYLVEVRRENMAAEKQLGHFAGYLLFFPKIIAGPVERAQHFLPQYKRQTQFDYALVTDGLKQFGWGLFKKCLIANRLGLFVDSVYGDLHNNHGPSLLMACILFSLQLYADFSGYTDMALGSAKILGYELSPNFNLPFSSKSMTEFWRRWHISLSSWFNDYFFGPLSISLRSWGKWGIVVSFMLSFLLLGFWHGANWTYIVFGGIHGLMIAAEFLTTRPRKRWRKNIPVTANAWISILYTFLFFSFSCIFFRSHTVADALYIIRHLFSGMGHWFNASALKMSVQGHQLVISDFVILFLSILFMFFVESKGWLKKIVELPRMGRWAVYYFFLVILIVYSVPSGSGFIYKQF